MYVRPSEPLSIGGVVDDAIRLYRGSFSHTWKLSVAFAIALAVLGLFMVMSIPALFDIQRATLAPQQVLALFTSPVVIGSYLLMIVCELVFYGALFASENAVARGEPIPMGQALLAGLRRIPGMLLAGLVFLIAFTLGCIALLIPGIYLWGKLQLWPAALYAEDATAMEALGSSWTLTRGRWWRTVVIISVALIILYIVALAVGLVPAFLLGFTSLKHGNMLTAQLAAMPFSILSRIFLMPAMPAILLAVHHDCKLRSEGGDLAERAGALGRA